jgi:hypothetical protein
LSDRIEARHRLLAVPVVGDLKGVAGQRPFPRLAKPYTQPELWEALERAFK